MPQASYLQSAFLGGEISLAYSGRYDLPAYRISMAVCLNAFPLETGAWTRRPGSAFAGAARGGNKGRVIKFDFEAAIPYTMEFTDGVLRFRNGAALIVVNTQSVLGISTANPAVVNVTTASATGKTVMFSVLGTSNPLLQNRQFLATNIDGTHYSIADALTGASINGSTLGAFVSGSVSEVYELTTVYTGGSWSTVRAIQAETTDILLCANTPPQALTVPTLPNGTAPATFALAAALFTDGPYLDPFTNGAIVTPNAKTGIVQLLLSFPVYSATTAYAVNALVTSSGVNYISLADQNVNNTPASSPTFWSATNGQVAINNGQGFLPSDIGRSLRLFSEPLAWATGTSYSAGNVVSYNPSGIPGGNTYWQSLTSSNSGNAPGKDLTNWELLAQGSTSNPAQWTWGRITSLANTIPGAPSGIAYLGDMTAGGGLSAAFDGSQNQVAASSASKSSGLLSGTFTAYDGENFSGCSTTGYAVASVTVFPPTDTAFFKYQSDNAIVSSAIYLYGSNSPPSSYNNGTLLGSVVIGAGTLPNGGPWLIGTKPVTINSSNTTTTYTYIWVALVTTVSTGKLASAQLTAGQIQFVSSSSSSSSAGVNVEILGPPLLYTTAITTWRLGAYSNTTGYPTCGCYADGRIWLMGAISNRFDACYANGIVGGTINMAPTDQYGQVTAAHAISYTLNSDSVNPILWAMPDLQGVLMGTLAGEWLAYAPTAGSIAPTNIAARRATRHGCAFVEPLRTEHTSVFVQRYSIKLMEYFADVFSGKFSAPNLADKTARTRTGIAELAYTHSATPIIWGRCNDGSLFGVTYKRDTLMTSQGPTFAAWHGHALGSGRTVESVCAGPSVGGALDALTMVTSDGTTRHVEVLTDTADELTPLTSQWLLDDAVNPTSVTSSNTSPSPYGGLTLNGLWHLNGKTVQVFAGGLDCGLGELGVISDFVVTNGSLTIPYGDGVSAGAGQGLFTATFAATLPLSQIVVGFTYNSDGQLLRPNQPQETGARNGPGFGKLGRAHWYALQVVNTTGLSIGTSFAKLDPVIFRDDSSDSYPTGTLFTGVQTDVLDDEYSFDSQICWRISRPWPAMITVAGGFMAKSDK